TILSWLAGTPAVRSTPKLPVTSRPAAAAATPAAAESIALHDWNRRSPSRGRPSRDIFSFNHQAPPAAPTPLPKARLFEAPIGKPDALAPMLFKLIGFAEDPGPDGPVRTAIIAGQDQLYLVHPGDVVATIYKVGEVGRDAVQLIDTTGGP